MSANEGGMLICSLVLIITQVTQSAAPVMSMAMAKADILIGAPNYSSDTGKAYLIYGNGNLANINLANLGTSGITITGGRSNYYTGLSVSSADDVCKWGWNADTFISSPTFPEQIL